MTILTKHRCLVDGQQHPGSYLDCPQCRDALIKSFGEAVPEENSMERSPQTEQHATTADTEPNDGEPGGRWVVSCTCGWRQSGRYARDGGEPVALRLASLKGAEHEENPDRRCAYCGNPHRLGMCTFCSFDNRHHGGGA